MESSILIIGIIGTVVAAVCVFMLCQTVIKPFFDERAYIKVEMSRSLSDREYRYWERQLKKLYIRSIPFVGRFFVKRK